MEYEKSIKVIKDGCEEVFTYYIRKIFSQEFECVMYNVGIESARRRKEIDCFSPSFNEAKKLCDYLYGKNVTEESLFCVAEEFIVTH